MIFETPVTYHEGTEPVSITAEQVFLFLKYMLTMNDDRLPASRPAGCKNAAQHSSSALYWLEMRWFSTQPHGQDPELQSIANRLHQAMFGTAAPRHWSTTDFTADTPFSQYVQFLILCMESAVETVLLRFLYRYVAGFSQEQTDLYEDAQRYGLSRAECIRRADLGRQLVNAWDEPMDAKDAAAAVEGLPQESDGSDNPVGRILRGLLDELGGHNQPVKPTKH
jgi:hypothetical protein